MKRLTLFTAVALCIVSLTLNLAFAERTDVKWQDIRLQSSEVAVRLENSGSKAWDGLTLTARVFDQGEKPVAVAFLKQSRPVQPEENVNYRLMLDRKVPQGQNYRVVMYLQQGNSRVVSQLFSNVSAFDLNPLRKNQNAKGFDPIPEPQLMKKTLTVPSVRSALGIF